MQAKITTRILKSLAPQAEPSAAHTRVPEGCNSPMLLPSSGGLLAPASCPAGALAAGGWLPVARGGRWRGAGRLRRVDAREKGLCTSYTLSWSPSHRLGAQLLAGWQRRDTA